MGTIRKFPALIWSVAAVLSLTAIATIFALMIDRYRLRSIDIPSSHGAATAIENGAVVIRMPNKTLSGEFARYDDEFFAYLIFG